MTKGRSRVRDNDGCRPPELDTVRVEYAENGRFVKCFCGQRVSRSIVPHLKKKHGELWEKWVVTFVELRGLGYSLKRIMRLFRAADGNLLFSWTVVERAIRQAVDAGEVHYKPPSKKRVAAWQPDAFALETTTLWDFPRRGDWAVHSGDYRGNWPPQVPRNLIERYTQKGDLVVDAFCGGGTTLVEAWLLGRRSIGLDISGLAIQTANAKLQEMEDRANGDDRVCLDGNLRPVVAEGSATELGRVLLGHGIAPGDARLVCAHPPYLNSLQYTTSNNQDLSLIKDPEVFYGKMLTLAHEIRGVLCPGGVCAVLVGDVRKDGNTVPLGLRTLNCFLEARFELDSIVAKTQHRDRSSEFYMGRKAQGLLVAHEYLFILRNLGSPREER